MASTSMRFNTYPSWKEMNDLSDEMKQIFVDIEEVENKIKSKSNPHHNHNHGISSSLFDSATTINGNKINNRNGEDDTSLRYPPAPVQVKKRTLRHYASTSAAVTSTTSTSAMNSDSSYQSNSPPLASPPMHGRGHHIRSSSAFSIRDFGRRLRSFDTGDIHIHQTQDGAINRDNNLEEQEREEEEETIVDISGHSIRNHLHRRSGSGIPLRSERDNAIYRGISTAARTVRSIPRFSLGSQDNDASIISNNNNNNGIVNLDASDDINEIMETVTTSPDVQFIGTHHHLPPRSSRSSAVQALNFEQSTGIFTRTVSNVNQPNAVNINRSPQPRRTLLRSASQRLSFSSSTGSSSEGNSSLFVHEVNRSVEILERSEDNEVELDNSLNRRSNTPPPARRHVINLMASVSEVIEVNDVQNNEEDESERLARQLMEEEQAMLLERMQMEQQQALQRLRRHRSSNTASSHNDGDGNNNNNDDNNDNENGGEDIDALLDMAEEGEEGDEEGQGNDDVDPDQMTYEQLLELGQQLGDVQQERWRVHGKNIVNSLTVIKYSKDHALKDDMCVICQCSFEINEDVKILPCKHAFHKECVDAWLSDHKTCVTCKQSIDPSDLQRV